MAYNQALAERIDDYLTAKSPGFSSKKMFGGLCFMVDDKMCVGLIGDQLMARIDPEVYHQALQKAHVAEMDFTGRAMKGYVYISAEGLVDDSALQYWVDLALEFNPKAKSSKKKKN